MEKILIIFVGGGLGASFRYIVSGFVYKLTGSLFPWGTLAVNLAGSLLIGILWTAFDHVAASQQVRTFLLIGVLGAFTTFSTFTFETLNLLKDGEIRWALINIGLSNIFGILFVFLGIVLARLALKAG